MYISKSFPASFLAPAHVGLHKWMNDVLNNEFAAAGSEIASSPARANIREFSDRFEIEIAAPGIDKSDFALTLEGNRLTVKAQKKAEESPEAEAGKYTRREFHFASVARSFTLPKTANAEQIRASYNQGILTVSIPKQPEAQPSTRTVEIE